MDAAISAIGSISSSEAPRRRSDATAVQSPLNGDELRRRDSLKRREAVLKGKEGSRQRRRWENGANTELPKNVLTEIDRLLNNPWAVPPLPIDWETHPTHPRRVVPYYLAPLWDAQAVERSIKRKTKRKQDLPQTKASQVPREVRSRLKHARAAKGLLQDLEGEVRVFLQGWHEKNHRLREDGLHDADSEEEEIVFVGRNGRMHDVPERSFEHLERDKLMFDGLADEPGSSFG